MPGKQLQFDVLALDMASKAFASIARAADRLDKQLDRLDGKTIDVEAEFNSRKAEAQVGAFARDTRKKLEAALKALPDIEIDADSSDAQREIARIRSEMQSLADKKIGVDIDAAAARAEMERLHAELARLGADSADIQVKTDTAAAMTALGVVNAEVDRLDGRKATVKVDVDKSLSDSLIKVAQLGRALGSIALPAAAIAAAPQLASLGAAALTASGALGLLPAVATTAGVAIAGLKIAMTGFSDAVTADSPEKLAEAMKKLAPAAQQAVTAIRGLSGAFDSMRLDVQQRLFDGLGPIISKLGNTYLPILGERFGRISDAANLAGKSIGEMLLSANRIDDIKTIGSSAASVFENLSAAAKPLAAAFIDIAAVGGKVFAEISAGAQGAAQKFAAFISQARATGELEGWIRSGVTALQQLGSIAGNVAGVLGGIFKAATASGADFLGTLQRVTGEIRNFVNSAQGQTAITNVFRAIRETVDAAMPGVRALATAVTDVINKIADSGIGAKIGGLFSAIAQSVGPVAATLGNLAISAIGPLVSAFTALAPVLGPVAAGLAGVWAAAKLMQGFSAIGTAVSGFTTNIGRIGTTISGGGVMGAIKGLATSLGAGGILGIALGAAGAALGLWAGAQASAAQAVAEHQAAVSNLAGTLDKFSGAATQATAAFQANEIATRKLSDGTTTLGDALRNAGISSEDFVAATSGNQAKLEQLNAQLLTSAKGTQGLQDLYAKWKPRLDEVGIGFDTLALAALGNTQAFDQLTSALGVGGAGFDQWRKDLAGAVGPLGEIGSALGDMSGKFAEAQKQTKEAGAAAKDFGQVLDVIKPGLAGLKDGAQPLATMAAGFRDLGTSSAATAQKLAEAAAQTGGVVAGADAATKSMAASRQAFIDAAVAAGVAAPQAEALATSIGLIPEAAKVNFETNATGAVAEVNTLKFQLDSVPGQKQVTVNALTAGATTLLQQLGFTVQTLPNGQVQVTANTATAKAALDAFIAGQQNRTATVNINGNTVPAATALQTVLAAIAAGQSSVTINGNQVPAQVALAGILGQISAGQGTVTINGQSVPADQALAAFLAAVNAGSGTATINGNQVPADQVLQAFLGKTNSSSATVGVKANAGAAEAAINNAARPRTATITVIVNQKQGVRVAGQQEFLNAGGGVVGYSGGGVVRARRGYVVPGYAPGRDTVPAVLSRGEAVLVPELVRALGARRILAANAEASGGRAAAVAGSLASMMDGTIRGATAQPTVSAAVASAVGTVRGGGQTVVNNYFSASFQSYIPTGSAEQRKAVAWITEEIRKHGRESK